MAIIQGGPEPGPAVSSKDPRRWSAEVRSVRLLGKISQDALNGATDQLIKRSAMHGDYGTW